MWPGQSHGTPCVTISRKYHPRQILLKKYACLHLCFFPCHPCNCPGFARHQGGQLSSLSHTQQFVCSSIMIFFSFQVPPVALLGSSSSLCCQFVLEVFFRAFNLFIYFDILLLQNGETLYSVVWYRAGKQVTLTLIKTKCFTSKSVKKMDVAPRRLQVG